MKPEEQKIKLYVAMYEGKRLSRVEQKSFTAAGFDALEAQISSIDIPKSCTELKAFVWTDDTLKPVYICG